MEKNKLIYDEALDIVTESLEEHDNSVIFNHNGLNLLKKVIEKAQKQQKLLELYKQAYDKSNTEVLKMFTDEQDEKTTLSNIIGHLDNSETVVKIRELENEN